MEPELGPYLDRIIAELAGIRLAIEQIAGYMAPPIGVNPLIAAEPTLSPQKQETQRYQVNFTLPARPGVKRPMKSL